MAITTGERVRLGALLTGAVALGAGGAATAGKLVTSKDIKNGSIKAKDLNGSVRKAIDRNESLLVSQITQQPWGTARYAAPGASLDGNLAGIDQSAPLVVPAQPKRGFNVRGLSANASDVKVPTIAGTTVTLYKNGAPTSLSCTTTAEGPCTDDGSVAARAGDELILQSTYTDLDCKCPANVVATISLEPR